MSARLLPPGDDAVGRAGESPVRIVVDGRELTGVDGQTIAGVLLGADRVAWRTTARDGAGRGLFCGIGVCFDCLVEVDGVPDVRACRRRAVDGAVVRTGAGDRLPDGASASASDDPDAEEGGR